MGKCLAPIEEKWNILITLFMWESFVVNSHLEVQEGCESNFGRFWNCLRTIPDSKL